MTVKNIFFNSANKKRTKNSKQIFFPAITIVGVILFFFGKLFYPKISFFVTPDFGNSDLLHGYYPLKYLLWKSLHEGRIDLWTAMIGNGYPFFADGQVGTFSIINIIAYRLFPFIVAVNLVYIFTFVIAGWGMFLFSRSYKVSSVVALFSAVILIFSGFMIGQISHISLLQTAAYLPLQLYLARRLMLKFDIKIVAFFAFISSQQILTGNPQMVIYAHTAIAIFYFIETIIQNFGKPDIIKQLIKHLAIYGFVVVLSLIASAVLLTPNAELFYQSTRTKTVNMLSQFPYPPSNLATFLHPFIFGSPQNGTYPTFSDNWGNFWENNGYVGVLPLIAIFLSIFFLRTKRVLSVLLILFISILLVLGKYSPLYFIFQIPPWSFFRVPSRFLVMTDIFLSLAAALVLQQIITRFKLSIRAQTVLVLALIIIQFMNICYFFINYHPVVTEANWFQTPKMVSYLKKDQSEFRVYTIDSGNEWNKIFLTEGWKHPEKYLPFRENLILGSNVYYDIKKSGNYGSFRLKREIVMKNLLEASLVERDENKISFSTRSAILLGMLNTKYILADKDLLLKPFSPIYKTSNFTLYKNPSYLERARFVNGFVVAKTVDDVKKILDSKTFNPKNLGIVEKNFNEVFNTCLIIKCLQDIQWVRDDPQTVELQTSTDHPSLFILADTYYPGWNAYVDGKNTKIYPANIINRAILVPTGHHTVRFSYEPDSFKIGGIISIFGYGVIICLMASPLLSRPHSVFFAKRKYSSDS